MREYEKPYSKASYTCLIVICEKYTDTQINLLKETDNSVINDSFD